MSCGLFVGVVAWVLLFHGDFCLGVFIIVLFGFGFNDTSTLRECVVSRLSFSTKGLRNGIKTKQTRPNPIGMRDLLRVLIRFWRFVQHV